MQFSYRISEGDYVRACKIAIKSRRGLTFKIAAFWAFIVVCLILLFFAVQKTANQPQAVETEQTESETATTPHTVSLVAVTKEIAPLLGVLALFVLLKTFWIPSQIRRQYRKDTNSHGEMTIDLNTRSISIRSSVGTLFQSGWNAFTDWSEKRDLVLLRFPAGTYYIVNTKDLAETERGELRGILSSALPEKK